MTVVPLRLGPGDDLRLALEAWLGQRNGQAGWVIIRRELDPAARYRGLQIRPFPS